MEVPDGAVVALAGVFGSGKIGCGMGVNGSSGGCGGGCLLAAVFGSGEIGCGMAVVQWWQVLKSAYSYCDLNIDEWVEPGEESVPRCALSSSSRCLAAFLCHSSPHHLHSVHPHSTIQNFHHSMTLQNINIAICYNICDIVAIYT